MAKWGLAFVQLGCRARDCDFQASGVLLLWNVGKEIESSSVVQSKPAFKDGGMPVIGRMVDPGLQRGSEN